MRLLKHLFVREGKVSSVICVIRNYVALIK
jgi:hypothetical protein